MGYHRAGFDVVGVDINPQPDYPFEVHQGDWWEALFDLVSEVDVIHASPPCQASSAMTKGNRGRGWVDAHVDLIPRVRGCLTQIGKPFVIENVQGAALRRDLTLCGEMFGLGVIRHRYFELEPLSVGQPVHLPHRGRVAGWRHGQWYDGPYFAVYGDGGGKGTVAQWQRAMGIDWTVNRKSLAEAIPPAFTEHIGRQLMAHAQGVAA